MSGYVLCAFTALFFVIGPSVVRYVPRCMAGCMLMRMGADLIKEALLDAYFAYDVFE